tara:strand:- start:230 stop:523 length:294 start_codon:yes stop_codon:yes gene_type:complete
MSKFESIHIAPRKDKKAIYLCSWNSGEIVQLHSIETLREEYKTSNLFTEESKDVYFTCRGNGYDDLILEDYLKHSKNDDDFLNVEYSHDNMGIERIV